MLGLGHDDLAFLGSAGTFFFTDSLDLVIEGPLLVEVADLVLVSLVLEVVLALVGESLPLFPDLLHHLQCAHLWVCVHNDWSCFLHEDHVC